MSYQALYRKWRPGTFDEVKGQDAIVMTLKNQIISGRVGHAYLFCGTRGTGKTSVAKILARAVNCEHTRDGNPCNECDICRGILSESSMNVVEIDAASNNGVDNIRDIRDQVQYPPTQGRYRVFIIDEVHMLSTGAFNALLKTLEEPPEYVIFILATTEVSRIPVTVLSRCQRYDFKRIPVETIVSRLKELTYAEGIGIEDRALSYIAKQADGAMRDALSLLDECAAFHPDDYISYERVLEILGAADTDTFARLFSSVASGRSVDALKVIEDAVMQGRELSQFASDFLWFMRNLLIIKAADDASGIIDASAENLELMKKCAAQITREQLMRYIRVIAELINQMRFSSQKRVLLELAIIKLMTPQMEQSYDALVDRIDSLERKLADGSFVQTPPPSVRDEKAASAEPVQKKIELPRAQYEDIMKLRSDWDGIIDSLERAQKPILRNTTVETGGDDVIMIVFSDRGCYDLGSKDSAIERVAQITKERYGKEFVFRSRLKEEGETAGVYVTREELSGLINMEIEEE